MSADKSSRNAPKGLKLVTVLPSPRRRRWSAWFVGPVRLLACVGVLLTHHRGNAQGAHFDYDFSGNLLLQTNENATPPQILGQPGMRIVIPGESTSFSVLVKDTPGVSYQWNFNSSAISGATADSLLLTNVSTNNEGLYSVMVSNGSGTVLSSSANLYIDANGDGLPDSWEIAHFGNLNQTATGDYDGDGVSNFQEFLDGTDPTNRASALYRIALVNDGGTVVLAPDQPAYAPGQVVTLTAYGSNAVPFHAWTGDVVTRSNSITVTMTTNLNLFAHFLPFTFTWTNTFAGEWNAPTNWTPNLSPSTNESVVLIVPVTITLNTDVSLVNVTFGAGNSGPELTGTGRLTIGGTGLWSAGTMSGAGATIVLPSASFTIANSTYIYLNGRTFENQATTTWSSGGIMGLNGGVITNDAGALFQLEIPATLNYEGGVPRFDNAGTFMTATNGTTAFNGVAFNNYGTVNILGGTLTMAGGGFYGGTTSVPDGATIDFAGGVFNSSADSVISGAGTFMVGGGTATFPGTVDVTGSNSFINGTANLTGNYTCVNNTPLTIAGGAVNFDGSGTVAPNILNLNGTLGGAQTVTVGDAMTWTGGTMDGSGRTIIPPGATLTIAGFTGYGGVYLTDRTLENGGTTVWGGGNMDMTGVITNDAGASFQVQNSAAFNYEGGAPRFDNAGTFLPAPAGTTSFYLPLNNYGAINLSAGSVLSLSGGAQTGTITVPAGATINYAGGTVNATAGSSITGAGSLWVSGGTANLAGTVNLTGSNSFTGGTANLTGNYTCVNNTLLNIAGGAANFDGGGTVAPNILNLNGTLGGAQTVTVGNTLNWTGGTMDGAGRTIVQPGAALNIAGFTGYGGVYLTDRTLENGGTAVWGGGNLDMTGVITNDPGASFQIQNPAAFNYEGGAPRFDNAGTFLPPPAGSAAMYIPFNNYGAINLSPGGMLSLSGGVQAGMITVPAGATINCAGGTVNATAGSSITGAGTLLVSGGTANLAGTVNVTGSNSFINGTANLTGNYTCANNTPLTIAGGTVNFDGSGKVAPNILNLNGTLGGAQTVTVGMTMNWTGGTMDGSGRTIIPPGAALNIAGFTGYGGVYLTDRTLENGGTTVWGGGNFDMSGVITNDAGASFQIQNSAVFNFEGGTPQFNNAGTFLTPTAKTVAFYGIPLKNSGTVNIQGGILMANAGYVSSMNAVLDCALGGTTPGTNYGQLQVPGVVTLNGTLNLILTNNYVPTTNDSFTVLSTGLRNGTFANFIYPSNTLSMLLSNTATAVIVSVTNVFAVPRPLLLPPQLSGSNVELTWTAVSNATYRVEFSADLNLLNWNSLPGDVTAVTNVAGKLDAVTATNRFYRIRVLP